MNLLLLRVEKTRTQIELQKSFEKKGFNVKTLNLKKLSLLSDRKKTELKNGDINFDKINAVYLRAPLQINSFVEPLLDIFKEKKIYCQYKPNSYYNSSNEALQFNALNLNGIKIAKVVTFGDSNTIQSHVNKFEYPVLFKSFRKQQKSQTILVESARSLKSIAKSIRFNIDGAVIREFVEGPVEDCAVIGDKVFTIRRKWLGDEPQKLSKGKLVKLSKTEKETAVKAAQVCGFDIATVKLAQGNVSKVRPGISYLTFSKKSGDSMFDEVADFYSKKLNFK